MIVEIFENLMALGLLSFFDLRVALLELSVLSTVLTRDLLVLLPNNVRLCSSVLELQCLLAAGPVPFCSSATLLNSSLKIESWMG